MRSKKILNFMFLILYGFLIILSGCVKNSKYIKEGYKEQKETLEPFEKELLEEMKKQEKTIKTEDIQDKKKIKLVSDEKNELDFYVQNLTGKTVYVVCFSYISKEDFTRWHWDKTNVYKIEKNKTVLIDVDTITNEEKRNNTYGYLAVFDNKQKAENSIYELLDDKKKLDLDLLYRLKNQKIVLYVEQYGIKGEILSYDIPLKDKKDFPNLDFVVENKTGEPVWVTCFIYQIKENMPAWRFDKIPIQKIENNQLAVININEEVISKQYDIVYMRGILGIFNENEKEEAEKSTYQLLKPKNKLNIGRIAYLKNKKVTLEIEKYGIEGEKIDFTIQPIKKIYNSK